MFERPELGAGATDSAGDRPLRALREAAEPVPPSETDPSRVGPASATAEIVLAQGCTSACAYCFSRLARGRVSSAPPERVADEVRAAYARGAREIRLASLDTAAWGADRPDGARLSTLLDEVAGIPGDFQVRVGMMSPQTVAPFASAYFAALDRPRFFSFLHLPVQSGSDRVLDAMRRGYRAREAAELVDRARRQMPDLLFATDMIVGYPGETDDDFRATLAFVEEREPEIVNVTRFSPRPFTPAARLRPVAASAAKERSRALARLRLRVARRRLERWIGRTTVARVVEVDAEGNRIGRLPNYLPVAVPRARGARLGDCLAVRVVGARPTYLLGRAVDGGASGSAPSVHLYTGSPR
jgi:MiaB/RimO family radical SAM methylthiotransferase